MKSTMYFDSVQEMNNYFPNGVPSKVLAIVKNGDKDVLYTSSNNEQLSGPTEDQGGYIDSPAAVDKSEEILYGEESE